MYNSVSVSEISTKPWIEIKGVGEMLSMKLLVVVVALMAACAQAKSACNMELQGGLRITATALEFTTDDKIQYKILKDQDLWVNDRILALNPAQQQLVKQYATSIRALVPDVRQLSLEGVDLASEAMHLVFQELLEPDNETAKKIDREFALLMSDIKNSFADGKPININQKGVSDGDFFGMNFETRISNIVEAAGQEISWNLIKSLGSAIFSDSDKRGDFETRMNKFGEKMDHQMKQRSEQLDKRGNTVCNSIIVLDAKEEELKRSIKEIAQFNLIFLKTNSVTKQTI